MDTFRMDIEPVYRLEFDFFIIPMPFYTGCAGVPLDVKIPYSTQYKKAWYDQKYWILAVLPVVRAL